MELCSSRQLEEYLKFSRCPTLVIWIFCSKIQWTTWCPLLRKRSSGEASRVQKESSGGRIFTSSKYTWSFGITVLSPFLQGQRKGWQGGPEGPSRHPLSELPGPWPWHRGPLHSALWSLCTCWACPHPGPLLAFSFSSFKRPQGGPRAQWLDSQVASQRPCCPIERPVESQGEREEDRINHEGWESRQDWIEVEGFVVFFFSWSCCCRCWSQRSWTSAQTHAELKKQQDKFLKSELGEGQELGVGRTSEKERRNDSNPQTKEAPVDQPSPGPVLLWLKYWFV